MNNQPPAVCPKTVNPKGAFEHLQRAIERVEREGGDLTFADIAPNWRASVESGDDRVSTNLYYMGIMLAEVDRLTEALRVAKEKLRELAICPEHDCPGDTPIICGYECCICGAFGHTESFDHKPGCILHHEPKVSQ